MRSKVILIVIDALTSRVVNPAIRSGKLPTLKRLVDSDARGSGPTPRDCISSFPSITPAATCSIVTGEYPSRHNIAGAFWRDGDDESIAYYGDDFWALMHKGLGEYFDDYLLKLNFERLKASTLFQQVEDAGLTAACINYMWFRGNHRHQANTPLLLELLPGVRSGAVIDGPTVLALADFVSPVIPGQQKPSVVSGGFFKRFGFHDDVTGEYLMELTHSDPFPDFTLAYFPNNDFESHQVGPEKSLSVVAEIDRVLGEFFDAMGGLDQVLDQFCVMITGDHSHSELVEDSKSRGIGVDDLLSDFTIASVGLKPTPGQLLICPNMRATQIYTDQCPNVEPAKIAASLLSDARVDQVMVRDRENGKPPLHYVITRDRGTLQFSEPVNPWLAECEQRREIRDEYGNDWCVSGSLETIDASITSGTPEQIQYGDYPNALERIARGFCESSADIWVTAHPGYEFRLPGTNVREAASHGSLHAGDSLSPFIVAGIPTGIQVPDELRLVDIAPLCRSILELPTADSRDGTTSRHSAECFH